LTGSSTRATGVESPAELQCKGEWHILKSPMSKRKEAKKERQMVDINSLTLEEVSAVMKIKRAERGIEIAARKKNEQQVVNKPTTKSGGEKETNSKF